MYAYLGGPFSIITVENLGDIPESVQYIFIDSIPIFKLENQYTIDFEQQKIVELPRETAPNIYAEVANLTEENKLLKAQLSAATARNDFVEDCLAELAGMVYGT